MILTEEVTIRPMQLTDLEQVFKIEFKTHVAPWTWGILRDCILVGYACFVMTYENKVIAYLIARIAANECHILNICVKPEEQRKGLGEKLMYFILDLAKTSCDRILLEVRHSNQPAIHLYEKLGFKSLSVRKDYYPVGEGREDAIVLQYDLK